MHSIMWSMDCEIYVKFKCHSSLIWDNRVGIINSSFGHLSNVLAVTLWNLVQKMQWRRFRTSSSSIKIKRTWIVGYKVNFYCNESGLLQQI